MRIGRHFRSSRIVQVPSFSNRRHSVGFGPGDILRIFPIRRQFFGFYKSFCERRGAFTKFLVAEVKQVLQRRTKQQSKLNRLRRIPENMTSSSRRSSFLLQEILFGNDVEVYFLCTAVHCSLIVDSVSWCVPVPSHSDALSRARSRGGAFSGAELSLSRGSPALQFYH